MPVPRVSCLKAMSTLALSRGSGCSIDCAQVIEKMAPVASNLLPASLTNHGRFFSSSNLRMVARPLVLCGPSGVGKSTILARITKEFPDAFGFSVSHTTRSPREGEEDGVSYHFTDRESMQKAIDEGEFIEHAVFSGNMYGTSKTAIRSVMDDGKICILDIDMQGVKQIKETDLNPLYVFIKPPSIEELEKRLRGRGTETEESLTKRLSAAAAEIEYGETPGNFDLIVVNEDIDAVEAQFKEFLGPHVEALKQEAADQE